MKILFISGWGSSVPLAMACKDSGHEIRFFIEDKDSKDVGDGFVDKTDDYKSSTEWADFVITDDTHLGKINDGIRKKGIPVLGGSEMTDALEEERHLGQKLFKSVGLDILESKEFKSIEEAISYVQDNPKPYVIKVSGTAQNDKTTTYVGESDDGSDVCAVLDHASQKADKGTHSVEIQEKAEGLETAVSCFFNGKSFVGPCQVNFEHKKLMPGPTAAGSGPNTGEMGTTAVWMDRSVPLFKNLILPMETILSHMGYRGDFDINAIVQEDGRIRPLEMTNRFGWPTLPMQVDGLKDNDLGKMFYAMAKGDDPEIKISNPFSMCVVIGVPPLPYMNDEIFEKYSKDMPILFRYGSVPEGFYPGEAKIEDGQWKVAGSSGCVAVCAASGYSIEDCRKHCYALAEEVIIPNAMIRNDIGKTTQDALERLEDLGLISTTKETVS